MVSGSEQEHLAVAAFATWIWGLVATGAFLWMMGKLRGSGAKADLADLPTSVEVIEDSHTDRKSTLIVRSTSPLADSSFTVEQLTLDDLVLAYMSKNATDPRLALETTP